MALFDMPLEELRSYKPERYKEDDLESFWEQKISQLRSTKIKYQIEKIEYIVSEINAYRVVFEGYSGSPICGYYLTPKTGSDFPVLLIFHGYNGNKGPISLNIRWPLMGYAVFAIDIRGQAGESIDTRFYPGPSRIGYMTKGIFKKDDYYYLGVYLDCIRAIDFLAERKEIDIKRLCITGSSQGGGLTLAAAGLDDRAKLAVAELPYLCHFKRAVELSEEFKATTYPEIASLIAEYPEKEDEIYKTLSYYDNLNLCGNIKAKTIITCALKDTICPPSTVFAVYNNIGSDKHIELLPYSQHDLLTTRRFDQKKLEHIVNNL
jgi:cephalosporin-C deacetylase